MIFVGPDPIKRPTDDDPWPDVTAAVAEVNARPKPERNDEVPF